MSEIPSVLFICLRNSGKSQMAAGLLAARVGNLARIDSAGTEPGTALNSLSVEVLAEIGVDISAGSPKRVTPELLAGADHVIVLGAEAQVNSDAVAVERWVTDEPSKRGIEGLERMRLVRDGIAARVEALAARLA